MLERQRELDPMWQCTGSIASRAYLINPHFY